MSTENELKRKEEENLRKENIKNVNPKEAEAMRILPVEWSEHKLLPPGVGITPPNALATNNPLFYEPDIFYDGCRNHKKFHVCNGLSGRCICFHCANDRPQCCTKNPDVGKGQFQNKKQCNGGCPEFKPDKTIYTDPNLKIGYLYCEDLVSMGIQRTEDVTSDVNVSYKRVLGFKEENKQIYKTFLTYRVTGIRDTFYVMNALNIQTNPHKIRVITEYEKAQVLKWGWGNGVTKLVRSKMEELDAKYTGERVNYYTTENPTLPSGYPKPYYSFPPMYIYDYDEESPIKRYEKGFNAFNSNGVFDYNDDFTLKRYWWVEVKSIDETNFKYEDLTGYLFV